MSGPNAYERLGRWIDMEKAGRTEMWDYDPRPDIERLRAAHAELWKGAVIVNNASKIPILDAALDASVKAGR